MSTAWPRWRMEAMPSTIAGTTAGEPERRGPGDVAPLGRDDAGDRLARADDGAEGCRLAGAVAADQADELAGAHLQRDLAQDMAAVDINDQVFDCEHLMPPALADHGGDDRRI